jgi:hypothetical protein
MPRNRAQVVKQVAEVMEAYIQAVGQKVSSMGKIALIYVNLERERDLPWTDSIRCWRNPAGRFISN